MCVTFALLVVVGAAQPSPDFTLEDLVQGNEQGLRLVHQIELEMQHRYQHYLSGKPYGDPHEPPAWRWARKGDLERARYSDGQPPRDDGRPQGFFDWFTDGSEIRVLYNWDPQNPQVITPLDQGTVLANILPPARTPLGTCDVTRFLLWTFNVDFTEVRRTLAEFVAASPRATLLGRAELDGHEVWHIRADHPGIPGRDLKGCYFEFFVDPAVNFSVRRVVEHQFGFQKIINGVTETYGIDIVRTVRTFQDVGSGVHVPTDIESRTVGFTSDSRLTVTDVRVSSLVVNQQLSSDALDFRFPENTLVIYSPPLDPNRQRVVLWGADNEPAKEIHSPQDVPGFDEAREQAFASRPVTDAAVGSAKSSLTLFWINLFAFSLVVGALLLRRWRRRGYCDEE